MLFDVPAPIRAAANVGIPPDAETLGFKSID
jgi:hypothetical protein